MNLKRIVFWIVVFSGGIILPLLIQSCKGEPPPLERLDKKVGQP